MRALGLRPRVAGAGAFESGCGCGQAHRFLHRVQDQIHLHDLTLCICDGLEVDHYSGCVLLRKDCGTLLNPSWQRRSDLHGAHGNLRRGRIKQNGDGNGHLQSDRVGAYDCHVRHIAGQEVERSARAPPCTEPLAHVRPPCSASSSPSEASNLGLVVPKASPGHACVRQILCVQGGESDIGSAIACIHSDLTCTAPIKHI